MSKSNIRQYTLEKIKELKNKNIPNPNLDVDILICYVLKKDKTWLYSNFNYELSKNEEKAIDGYINKRAKHIPIAYILGFKEFYKLKFFVSKDTLIPRSETEMIVDEVIDRLNPETTTTIIDIGSGSGAIIISLAYNIKSPKVKFMSTDISAKALAMALKNAKLHKVNSKIKFKKGNLLEPITKKLPKSEELIITANLPYLTPEQLKEISIKYEPKVALVAGSDGLKYYKIFFKQAKELQNKYSKITIIIEFDHSQTKKLEELISSNLPSAKTTTKKDLCGLDRIMIIEI